jgi:hypothetical protein
LPVGLLHVDLDEGAGELLLFPWRCRLTRAQAHDHILPADRLSGVQRDVLNDAVALVEDAEHRGPLRHWRHAALAIRRRCDLARPRQWRILLGAALAAGGKRYRDQQGCGGCPHAYSGIQGS